MQLSQLLFLTFENFEDYILFSKVESTLSTNKRPISFNDSKFIKERKAETRGRHQKSVKKATKR